MFRVVIIADGFGSRNGAEKQEGKKWPISAGWKWFRAFVFREFRKSVIPVRRLLDFAWGVLYASRESGLTPEIRTTQNGTVTSIH